MSEPTHPMLDNGVKFGVYRIEEFIADGGMAEIYRAVDLSAGQVVALKVIPPKLARDRHYRDRFRHEAEAAGKLRHPNIVPVYASGEERGTLFLAMRFIEPGGYPRADLRAVLSKEGPLALRTVRWMLQQVADALDYAHRSGLVHRDVTPYNILVERGSGRLDDSRVYLTDFGITRPIASRSSATRTTGRGGFVGTLHYVAPEEILNRPATPATDTYALGCVAYELLTGRPPYGDREHEAAVIFAILSDPVPTLDEARAALPDGAEIPAAVDEALAAALAKDPADRPASAPEFVAALDGAPLTVPAAAPAPVTDAAVAPEPVEQEQPASARPAGRRIRARTAIVGLAVTVLVAAAALAAERWWPGRTTQYAGGKREAPVALTYPSGWHEYDQPGVSVLFSPLDVHGVFSGQPSAWQDVIRTLDTDPRSAAGVYVRAINAAGSETPDSPDALKREVGQDITTGQNPAPEQGVGASRVDWDDPVHDVVVGGRPVRQLTGQLRAPSSTHSLRLRVLVIRLDSAGRSVHVVLFGPGLPADPAAYDDLLATFRSVQDSLTFPG